MRNHFAAGGGPASRLPTMQSKCLPRGFLSFDHNADQASISGHVIKHYAAIRVTTDSDMPYVIVRCRRCLGHVDDERSIEVLGRFLRLI